MQIRIPDSRSWSKAFFWPKIKINGKFWNIEVFWHFFDFLYIIYKNWYGTVIFENEEYFFFCRQINSWVISSDILWGLRLFGLLNCSECSEGHFRDQKSRGPLKITWEMAHKLICLKRKNQLSNFHNQWYSGNFMSHSNQVPTIYYVPLPYITHL